MSETKSGSSDSANNQSSVACQEQAQNNKRPEDQVDSQTFKEFLEFKKRKEENHKKLKNQKLTKDTRGLIFSYFNV